MRIGVLGTGRIGVMHARNLAQTAGVDEVVLMGRDPARLAVSVDQVSAAQQPDARRSSPEISLHLARWPP